MAGSLNHFGNLTSRISRLKGDPITTAINSISFSFMAVIVRRKSSIRITPCPMGGTSGCQLCTIDCWDCSWSHLLFSMSLKSASWPNLLKMLLELLISQFWLRHTLSMHLLAPTEACIWERITSALGLAPVHWVLTAIGFLPIRCIRSAIEFLPIRRPLGAFGISPICCERGVCCPLVGLFLLVLAEVELWGERSGLRRVSLLVYEDFRASILVDGPSRASGCRRAWELIPYAKCAKEASICSIVTLTASTSHSTCVKTLYVFLLLNGRELVILGWSLDLLLGWSLDLLLGWSRSPGHLLTCFCYFPISVT